MVIEYKKSESSVQPEAVDETSSAYTIYLHKNINKVTRTNTMGDKETTTDMYEYDEAKLTRAEYAQYLAEQANAKTEYIAMAANVNTEAM